MHSTCTQLTYLAALRRSRDLARSGTDPEVKNGYCALLGHYESGAGISFSVMGAVMQHTFAPTKYAAPIYKHHETTPDLCTASSTGEPTTLSH
ncbi:hypothetical protein BaRGS_00017760 [Batillaria attramentaria]|uniref:Uncharacterized protein n=1 Tax=Batillaria attramentaria TaxID=370345 RepID=A0ABD0KVZ9_9CAEN